MKPSIAVRALVPHVVPDDTIRFIHDDGMLVVAVAAGSEGDFSAYWPPASRFILDLFEEHWRSTTGLPAERLAAAFPRVRERFAAEASARLDRTQADIDESGPTGQLFAVAITGTAVHAAWQSGAFAFLARDGAAIDPTRPH